MFFKINYENTMKSLAFTLIAFFSLFQLAHADDIFDAMADKMKYTNKRQEIIAKNIANADTPKYKTKDLAPVDFTKGMKSHKLQLVTTSPSHINPAGNNSPFKTIKQRETYETKPNGNNVSLEEQSVKMSENDMEFRTTAGAMRQMNGLIRMAIGTGL